MDTKLFKVLQKASNDSMYYKELFEKCGFDSSNCNMGQFVNIPYLTRKQLNLRSQDILHKDFRYVNRKELLIERTSGSTGHFVEVFWNYNEFVSSNMSLWRKRYKWYGISPSDRKCTFFTDAMATDKILYKHNSLEFSSVYMGENDIKNYLVNIQMFQPKWLMISPSIALLLLDYCRKNSVVLPKSVKYIELFGENVSSTAYECIVDYFNVPTSIMYGAKEVNGIGLTCPYGHMHVLDDNNYVEVTDQGSIIITNLHNTYFPIIRYEIGDMVTMANIECPCGENSLIIDKIYGKNHYLTYLDKRSGITTGLLKNVVDEVDAIFDYPIIQFKIQYSNDIIIIHLFCKHEYNRWKKEIESAFHQKLQCCLRNATKVDIQFHNSPLPHNEYTGKLPIVEIN